MKSNFITMASKGDGVEFGTLNPDRGYHASASNSVRVLNGGGYHQNVSGGLTIIDSITTASLEMLYRLVIYQSVGMLLEQLEMKLETVFVGGTDGTTDNYNIMEFINFASSGNALDFGDLQDGRYGMSGLSDSHGGLEVSNMANLRTNNLSGEGGKNALNGSVYFDGYIADDTPTSYKCSDSDDLDMGTGDFTFEVTISSKTQWNK